MNPEAPPVTDTASTNSTTVPFPPPIRLIRDSKGHLFRDTGAGIVRCDEHGQPLIRLRGLSKNKKRTLRAFGITASKWVQTNQNHA